MTDTFLSHDAGSSWQQMNLHSRVRSVAFDPVDPDRIYLGTDGLYRSTDRGRTWTLLFPEAAAVTGKKLVCDAMMAEEAEYDYLSTDCWPGGRVHGICLDPFRKGRIFVAVLLIGESPGEFRFFRSDDEGGSWRQCFRVGGKAVLRNLFMCPPSRGSGPRLAVFSDTAACLVDAESGSVAPLRLPRGADQILGAACGMDPGTGRAVFYVATPVSWEGRALSGAVLRSLDEGRSWHETNRGLEDDFHGPENGQHRYFTAIATCERDTRTVYLAVWRSPEIFREPKPQMNYQGIFLSRDMGAHWSWSVKIGDHLPESMESSWMARCYDTDWFGTAGYLAVSPGDPAVCLSAMTGSMYHTRDGGASWRQIYADEHPDGSSSTRGIEATTCYGLHIDPFDREHIGISFTDIGAFHSCNRGRTMHHAISGVPYEWKNTCYWMAFDPEVRGRAWSVWSEAHDLPRVKMFMIADLKRYQGGVMRSDDGLRSWRLSNDGMPEHCSATHILLDPDSPAGRRTLYVCAFDRGVYRSTDDGATWAPRNRGIHGGFAWRITRLPGGLLYLVSSRGVVDGKTVSGAIHRSSDGAESWWPVPMPAGVSAPNDLVYDPADPRRMYLTCWPETADGVARGGGLYATGDRGETWENVFDPSSHAYGVTLDPQDPAKLFLCTFQGSVHRSDDRGRTWRRLKGFNFKWPHRVCVDPSDSRMIYVLTFGSAIWYGPADGDADSFECIPSTEYPPVSRSAPA